ncbi:TRAP transporter small permease [Virgibacillus oceani]
MRKLTFITDVFNKWILNILAILFGIVSLITLYQVFARYVLGDPLSWSEAVVRYTIIWIVLLGTAVALRKGRLISVETLHFLVPKTIQKILTIIILIINIAFCLFLILYGFDIMRNLANQESGALGISVSWFYAALPVGGVIALINAVVSLIELIVGAEQEEKDDSSIVH